MTQEREGLSKANPKPMLITMVEVGTPSRDLKPSQELLEKIAMVKESLTTAGKLIKESYDLAIRDGFSPKQAREFLTAQLPFLAERTIRQALPDEAKDQSKVRHSMPQKQPLPKTINVSTEHKVIDIEPEQKSIPTVDLVPEVEEEPTELELANIKIAQLEDALHKTEQFKPATAFSKEDTETILVGPPESYFFDFLQKKADGVHSFYYDAYGIDLFKNRELSQLKNSGVRVFKRLYFEV